jgi:hypothetical protein
MERWITPVLFACASGGVWYYNSLSTARQAVFPGLYLVPGHEDMLAQGRLTWQLFAGIAVLTAVFALIGQIRAFLRSREAAREEGS